MTAAQSSPRRTGMRRIDVPGGHVAVDPESGGVASLRLARPEIEFIDDAAPGSVPAGVLRLALPLPDHFSHYAEVGTHGAPEVAEHAGGLRLTYDGLNTAEGPVAVHVEIDLVPDEEGLRLRARVHNGTAQVIPQIVFPQLLGLAAVEGVDGTRVQLGRGQIRPLRELAMRPDDAHWLELRLQRYVEYGKAPPHNMKWLDYGGTRGGLTLFSRDTRYHTTGLLIERTARDAESVHLRWAHYPYVGPGEMWDSGDFVLVLHSGDWYAGARAYQRFASKAYPSHAPRRVREALGVRSVWAAVRGARPTFPLAALADFAAEIADAELGLTELIVWHWWLRNGYPIFLDPRLGTEAQFRDALEQCRALGVPVALFVSHRLQRDNSVDTDDTWVFRNAAGQRVLGNWTYGPGFVPRFGPPFMGTHSMVQGSALSPGYRRTGLEEYRGIQEKYGPVSICFDQFCAWPQPDYNPHGDGRPNEEGERLLEFGRQARALIQGVHPAGTFSGEHITDTKVPVLDYTWEWKNGFDIADAAPFRYVFPQVRLNANVNEHPRGALIGFMEGALLNVMPGNMHSFRLRDCPDLVAMLKKLAALRKQYLRYFTEGQYRFTEGLTVEGGSARVYTHEEDVLVIVVNPTDDATDVTVSVDPAVWGGAADAFEQLFRLGPDGIGVLEAPAFRVRTVVQLWKEQ